MTVQTDRLAELLEDSESHRDEVLMSGDELAGWPHETALGLFDIITVCLQSKQRLRLPIRQVRMILVGGEGATTRIHKPLLVDCPMFHSGHSLHLGAFNCSGF